MYILRRREILEPDPPINWPETLTRIRAVGRLTTADICFTLNIDRSMLWAWEKGQRKPNFEHGRLVLKYLEVVQKTVPLSKPQTPHKPSKSPSEFV